MPRVGSSNTRKILENLTGVATGSEMPPQFGYTLQLQHLKGDFIADKSVWVVKSHAPLGTADQLK